MIEKNGKLEIRHDLPGHKFEIKLGSQIAVLNYHRNGDTITFTHTGVPTEFEGRGFGSRLVHAGMEYAREKGLKVEPMCWFVAGYIDRHPEYQNLLR